MKKIDFKKISFKKAKKDKSIKSKIVTQKNLDESRSEVLAKGKRFKYPFQYAKHRLVINTILICVVATIAFTVVGWVELYKVQNTSEVIFRFTKVLPIYVAEIDGVKVRYSDYLMLYRSSINSIERQQGEFDDSEESKQKKELYQRQAMDAAQDYTYALAKIEENGLEITDEEIDEIINDHRMINGVERSEEAFEGIVRDNFGLTMSEYRRLIKLSLAKKKYSENFDESAEKYVMKIEKLLKENDNSFSNTMNVFSDDTKAKSIVSRSDRSGMEVNDLDGGRAYQASLLEKKGDVSKFFTSKNGDGYYIVRLASEKGSEKISYDSIFVRFTEFDELVSGIRNNGGIKEYIDVVNYMNTEGIEAEEK